MSVKPALSISLLTVATLGLGAQATPAASQSGKPLPGRYARCAADAKGINNCADVLLDAQAKETQIYFELNKAYCSALPLEHGGSWAFTPQVHTSKGSFRTKFTYESNIPGHQDDAGAYSIDFSLSGKFSKNRRKLTVKIDGKVTKAIAPSADCMGVTMHETHILKHVKPGF